MRLPIHDLQSFFNMEERPSDPRTLFVRNVPYDVDDAALEELASEVGPVKQAFLIKRKGGERHQGFGFVLFALEEDAQRALVELAGRELGGRKLKVRTRHACMSKRTFEKGARAAAAGGNWLKWSLTAHHWSSFPGLTCTLFQLIH